MLICKVLKPLVSTNRIADFQHKKLQVVLDGSTPKVAVDPVGATPGDWVICVGSSAAREFVGGGYVTVLVRGETGAVNAAVRAGADACERVGDGLVAAHIIARPHSEVEPVLVGSGAARRS